MIVKQNADSVKKLSSLQLVHLISCETSYDALFQFIVALACVSVRNYNDAVRAINDDPSVRQWAEATALLIPFPYNCNNETIKTHKG